MPPKKGQPVDKKKQQAASDATFGMKNKKGKKAQMVAKQAAPGRNREEQAKYEMNLKRKAEKEEQKKIDAENALLFRKVEEKQKPQLVPPGVDPKSVLCIYFKKGNCQFGDSCKLSHDLALDGKKAKADMFTDSRAKVMDEETLKNQDMSQWDDETLKRMLAKKNTQPANASEKVCRQFLKAIEDKRWGWFWVCPNGGDKCPYKHALPQGYVFKDKKAEKVETRTLEDVLEEERANLGSGGTKVTPETFAIWYEKIKAQKEAAAQKNKDSRQKALKSGARMTGREVLSQADFVDPDADGSDGDEIDLVALRREKLKEEEALDEENARMAVELNKAVEEELAETARERELNGEPAPIDDELETPKPTPTKDEPVDVKEPEAVLENVDTSLFTENIEDIPDDFSDDD